MIQKGDIDMANNPNRSDRYPLTTPKDLTKEIEAYKSSTDHQTRNGAIRALIRYGLEFEYERKPNLRETVRNKLIEQKED